MRIKDYKSFCESISGTELINVGGVVGPGYGEQKLPVTLTSDDTTVVLSKVDDQLYTKDDWDNLYNQYLSKGGSPLDGFNQENLDIVLDHLKNAM